MAKTLAQATKRPNNIGNAVPAPVVPVSPPPVATTIPRNLPGLSPSTHGPAPSVWTTQYDSVKQFYRPGTSQQRFSPLPTKANPQLNAAAASVATRIVAAAAATAPAAATQPLSIPVNPQTGTQYTVVTGDLGKLDTFNNNSGGTIILPGGSILPNVFSSESEATGASATLSATVAPFFSNSAVLFVGSCSAYASQPSGIVPSGSGWTAIDSAANGNYASLYAKLVPGVSSLTVTAPIVATAWAESLLVFQNVNKVPTVVQSKAITSGGVGTGTVSATFTNPVTAGNMILVLLSAGAMTNDSHGTPIPAVLSISDGINTYDTAAELQSDQDGGSGGPQAGYSVTQVVWLAQSAIGGATTPAVTVTFPSMSGGVYGSCTIIAYEISMGNAAAASTGFTSGWYCYIQNTGSGTFSVQSAAEIDGSSSPVSLGADSGLIVAFDGTNWFTERGDGGGSGGGAVSSVFGRTGAVAAQSGDYTSAQVTNAASLSGSYLETTEMPALTGDATSSAGTVATTVVALQGNAIKSGVPSDSDVLTYVAANTDWEPKPLSALGGANASQLRGNDISVATPVATQILQWNSADAAYDLVYNDYQAYATLWEEDFLTNRASAGGASGTPYAGGPTAWTAAGTGSTAPASYTYNQLPSHLGVLQTTLPSATANLVSAVMPTMNGAATNGSQTASTSLALLDNPGWKACYIFNFSRAWGEGSISSTTAFSIAHTLRYIGFANGLNSAYNTSSAFNVYYGCRPNIFLGVRYDTDAGATLSVSAVGNGTGVYTVSGGNSTANFYAGNYITFTNCGNAANNGTFMIKSSTSTTLTTTNTSSVTGSTLTGSAIMTALSDTTFKFEYVTNPFPFTTLGSTAWRNNNSGTVTYTGGTFVAGTVVDTLITPTEGTWYRLDMVCAATGVVTLTLSGGGSTATTTITCGTVSLGDGATNWTWAQANDAVTGTPGSFALLANGTNIQANVWGPGSILTVTTPPTGLTTPLTMVGSNSSNMVIGLQSGALTTPLTKASIVSGYPALWPMDIFGNDQSGSSPSAAGARTFGLDFFGLYYDPAIAGATYNADNSRYFSGT